jgi:predicted negative regulator of RcsB-dependent stress response
MVNFARFQLAFRVRPGKDSPFIEFMQAQDAPAEFLFKLWPWLEKNKNTLIGAVVGVLILSGILYYYSSQKEQAETDAGEALTALMTSPAAQADDSQAISQFEALAQKYPGTPAGQRAQLQAAGTLFEAGKYQDAQNQFQSFLAATPTGPLAATANFGIAASLEAQNNLDGAQMAYQRVISMFPDATCVPAAKFALGRIAEQQNKMTEAMSHYQEVLRLPMAGSVGQEAMLRASELSAKMAAAAPKTPAASVHPFPTSQKLNATPAATPTSAPAIAPPAKKP